MMVPGSLWQIMSRLVATHLLRQIEYPTLFGVTSEKEAFGIMNAVKVKQSFVHTHGDHLVVFGKRTGEATASVCP